MIFKKYKELQKENEVLKTQKDEMIQMIQFLNEALRLNKETLEKVLKSREEELENEISNIEIQKQNFEQIKNISFKGENNV